MDTAHRYSSLKFLLWRVLLLIFAIVFLKPRASADPRDDWFKAAADGDPTVLSALLKNGDYLDTADAAGFTALLITIDYSKEAAARFLIERGASIRRPDSSALSPLALACLKGQSALIPLLLEKGADVNEAVDFSLIFPTHTWQARLSEREKILARKLPEFTSFRAEALTPLMLAVLGNHTETAAFLLEHGAKVNAENELGMTPLVYAAIKGNRSLIELLIAKGADAAKSGAKALEEAELRGEIEATEVLLQVMQKPQPANAQLSEALFGAIRRGDYENVQALIYKGADVNYTNDLGVTPITALYTNLDIARVLLEHGANPDFTPPEGYGYHPFWAAVHINSLPLLEVLTGKGIKQEQLDALLIFAAQLNRTDFVRWLLTRGASVNATDTAGHNALVYALNENNDELAKVLKDAGAPSVPVNRDRLNNPLFGAVSQGDVPRVRLLLERGVDPNWPRGPGITPLGELLSMLRSRSAVVQTNRHTCALLLLEHGAKPNVVYYPEQPKPLLFFAVEAGDLGVVEAMLQKGADPNEVFYTTPLIEAVEAGNAAMVKLLVEKGADVNAKDQPGRTALAVASSRAKAGIINVLKAAGAHE